MPFRPDLQGLRAIAILLVVLGHANVSFLSGGFVGVDVFFVLSGYLITGLLTQEFHQTGRILLSRFYARRLKRLLPALMVMLLISAGAALWLLSDLEARAQLASAPFAASWTSNLYFVLRAVDYFNELASRDLFLHTWSLGVEEQFYLIWPPILLTMAWLVRRARTRPRQRMTMWLSLGLLLMASLGLALSWTISWPIAAFYLMPARIWQFTLGAWVYHGLSDYSERTRPTVPNPPGFSPITTCLTFGLGLILIIGSALLLHPRLAYPGVWALAPSLGAALVITAGHSLSARKGNPLAHPALVWLGDRSYSWYLWHWPILMLGFSLGLEDQPLANLGLILLSLLAALLSYRLVERPFWKGRFSHAMPKRILLLGFLTMAFGIAVLYYLLRGLAPAFTFSASAATIRPADIPVIYQMPCDAWYQHARVEPCVFGSADATKTVVILGDSIGLQWFSMVPALFPAPIWRTVVLTKSSCPMVDENFYYPRIKQVYSICTEWRNAVLAELERLQPDVLIIGSAATYDFTASQWIEGTARVLDRITNKVGNIFLIPGTPSLGFDGPGCVARALSPAGTVDRDACRARDRLALVAPVTDYLRQSVDRYPNSYLLDLNELVCPDGVCQALSSEGLLVFRDSQHLTDRFVRARTPQIGYKLKTLAPDVQFIGSLSAPNALIPAPSPARSATLKAVNPHTLIIEPGLAERHYWRDLWRYRELFYVLAWRDIAVRYKQTLIGLVWALVRPLLTMIVFTLVFGTLARMPTEGTAPYALLVFAGLLPWQFFATALTESSNSLIGNANLISKVYFPRLIVPAATIVVALVDFLISLAILFLVMLWYRYLPGWQILTLPVFVLMAFLASLGPGLWITALNVKYRDFRYVIPFIVTLGLYVSPVGFSSTVIPEQWRMLYAINPVVGVIDGFRWAILGGEVRLYWPGFLLSWGLIAGFLWLGIRQFRRMEKSFADLI